MSGRPLSLRAADGYALGGLLYTPPGEVRGGVVLAAAMGVPQSFYAPLATWLAAQGYLTLTFDYRGIGASRHGSLSGFQADVLDWAKLDCAAALDQLATEVPGQPLFWIGHSLGGQIFGLVPHCDRIAKLITVASGSGYWRENAAPLRYFVGGLWFVIVPLAMSVAGYFPGKRLRLIGDLPRGVMAQWRRWCLNPTYLVGAEGEAVGAQLASVHTPIVSLSFSDDEFMSARNIDSLHGLYANAPRKMTRLSPADLGMQRIGHFGFFRRSAQDALWPKYLLPELTAR